MPDSETQLTLDDCGHMPRAPDVALTFNATQVDVRRAMSTVRSRLHRLDLGEMCLGTIEIVLAEACNNVVEHAYQDTGKGVIGLSLHVHDGLVCAELTDCGVPMPGLEPPAKKSHDLTGELDDLPEGGFGWGLIRDMTKSLIYRRHEGRNIVRLSIEAAPDPA